MAEEFNLDKLSGPKKAAILLTALGPEEAAKVFKHMNDEDIEQLTLEIANLRKIPRQVKDEVVKEFYHLCQAYDYIGRGGIDYAQELLEKALGQDKANSIISRLTASLQVRPFDVLRKIEPGQLLNFIQNEHPQTIALIMAYLDAKQAGIVLSGLPRELQTQVTQRVALMERTSPDVIHEVERVLEDKLSSLMANEFTAAGGLQTVVDIINNVDRGTEKSILEELEIEDPELADEIRKKLFVFEDIVNLDDRAIQLIIREIETKDLGLALKTASEEVKEKVFRNMSQRASEMLQEDIEFMGPVHLREVEDAQQRIVNEIRRLEDAGEIVIVRGEEGDLIV
ncbi:MAG: flagellar motor switch protein FliG [Halanaerobium sp.]|nr:flagellar motor switch protein FliG [Halanaerobium sp.]